MANENEKFVITSDDRTVFESKGQQLSSTTTPEAVSRALDNMGDDD